MSVAASVLAATLLANPASSPDIRSSGPDSTAVTVYRGPGSGGFPGAGGVALIVETRTLELPAGASTVRFGGVAATLIPQTATIDGLPGADERTFDYDLLSPGALFAKSVGQAVKVVRTNLDDGRVAESTAVVRSGPNGVMLESEGRFEALGCGGGPTRVLFDRAAALRDSPTLSVEVRSPTAGRRTVRLAYLAGGFDWKASYVATLRPDGRSLDLRGWLTLTNQSDTGFTNAKTQVVAGKVALDAATRPLPVESLLRVPNCWASGGWNQLSYGTSVAAPPLAIPAVERRVESPAPSAPPLLAAQTDFGDYKLYTLPTATTVAARQTKQVAFVDTPAAPFERIYRLTITGLTAAPRIEPAEAVLRVMNLKARGLGMALPAGTVAVMTAGPDGRTLFAGGDAIEDAPVGLPVEIRLGAAPEIQAEVRTLVDERRLAPNGGRYRHLEVEVEVSNAKAEPARFVYRQAGLGIGVHVVSESTAHAVTSAGPAWELSVPPHGRRTLHFALDSDPEVARSQRMIASPDWLRSPSAEDIQRFYPERAARTATRGATGMTCTITANGTLTNCALASETPEAYGFGEATLRLARLYRMRPRTREGEPVEGGSVSIMVRFNPPKSP